MPGSRATRPRSSCSPPATSCLTEHKYDQLDAVVKLLREGLAALELPLRSFEIEFGPSQLEFTLAPMRRHGGRRRDGAAAQRGEADRAPPRLPRHLHVPAEAAERHVERLASAPVAHAQRPQRVYFRQGGPVGCRQALPRRPAGPCARRGRARHADHQRLQALPPLFARPRPRDLGQGEPRRDAARDRRAARSRHAHREPHRRAGGEPVPLLRLADLQRPGRHRAAPAHRRARPTRLTKRRPTCCRARWKKRCSI